MNLYYLEQAIEEMNDNTQATLQKVLRELRRIARALEKSQPPRARKKRKAG